MIKCFFDGCCEPYNPGGNMGTGAFILKDNIEIFKHSGFVPLSKSNSNNVAEYLALERILLFIKDYECPETKIFIYGDSKMVTQQMSGSWKIKHGMYKEYAIRCRKLLSEIKKELFFTWIPREINQRADDLSKSQLQKNNVEFKIQPNETNINAGIRF